MARYASCGQMTEVWLLDEYWVCNRSRVMLKFMIGMAVEINLGRRIYDRHCLKMGRWAWRVHQFIVFLL